MIGQISLLRSRLFLASALYCMGWLAVCLCTSQSFGALVRPGDILTTLRDSSIEPGQLELIRIDPRTGAHQSLVKFDQRREDGYLLFEELSAVIVDRDHNIFVATGDRTSIVRVIGINTYEIVSSSDLSVGDGVDFKEDPGDLALLSNGDLAFGGDDIVFRVNPIDGTRTILSGRSRGLGPLVDEGEAIKVRVDGQLLVLDDGNPLLLVDPATGNRNVVSGDGRGEGPPLIGDNFVVLPKGDVLFGDADRVAYEIGHIDVASGDRSVFLDATIGTGPVPERVESMEIGLEGDLLINDGRAIYRIDLSTGDRKQIPVDTSAFITTFRNLAVVPVPEPSTIVLAGISLGLLVIFSLKRNRDFAHQS